VPRLRIDQQRRRRRCPGCGAARTAALPVDPKGAAPTALSRDRSKALIWRRSVLAVVVASSTAAVLAVRRLRLWYRPEWRTFAPPGELFRVLMPADPDESDGSTTTPHGSVPSRRYSVDYGAFGACAVAYAEFGPAIAFRANLLSVVQHAREGFLEDSGTELVWDSALTVPGGDYASEFESKTKRGAEGTFVTRIFVAWRDASFRLYIVSIGGPLGPGLYRDRARFLDSFQLVAPKE
jgi:hypothetical protein